jgi:hypothetical protein
MVNIGRQTFYSAFFSHNLKCLVDLVDDNSSSREDPRRCVERVNIRDGLSGSRWGRWTFSHHSRRAASAFQPFWRSIRDAERHPRTSARARRAVRELLRFSFSKSTRSRAYTYIHTSPEEAGDALVRGRSKERPSPPSQQRDSRSRPHWGGWEGSGWEKRDVGEEVQLGGVEGGVGGICELYYFIQASSACT